VKLVELSRYQRSYALPGSPGECVVFSTRTAAAARVPRSVIEDAAAGRLAPREERTLVELGLLVESAAAERNGMLGALEVLGAQADTLRAIVVLNLDCNLACRYCFEGSRRDGSAMSAGTARNLAGFLRRERFAGQAAVALTFYGGEPLLTPDRLVEIALAAGEAARDGRLGFRFGLVTNGTLLTRALVERLRPLGLARVSVTLDGPREIHDSLRPYRDGGGRGSYDRIVRNLREVAPVLPVQVGSNFTAATWRELPRLLDDLAAAGLGPDVVPDVRFDPVLQEREGVVPPEFHAGCLSTNEPWLAAATVALRAELLRRGYRPRRMTPSPCMIDLPHQFVIAVDGSLYKCPGFLGRPGFSVGDLARGAGDHRRTYRTDIWKNEECLECAYLPLCFGGCRYQRLLREGDLGGVDCRRPFLEAALEHFVLQDLALAAG